MQALLISFEKMLYLLSLKSIHVYVVYLYNDLYNNKLINKIYENCQMNKRILLKSSFPSL